LFHAVVAVAAAFAPGTSLFGQAAAPMSDAEKRALFLKSLAPTRPAATSPSTATPRVSTSDTPSPSSALAPHPKIGFRSSGQGLGPRNVDLPPAEPAPTKPRSSSSTAEAKPPAPSPTPAPKSTASTNSAEPKVHTGTEKPKSTTKAASTPALAKTTPAATPKVTEPIPEKSEKKSRSIAEKSPAKASPAPLAKQPTTPTPAAGKTRIAEKPSPQGNPSAITKLNPANELPASARVRLETSKSTTPAPKPNLGPALTAIPSSRMVPGKKQSIERLPDAPQVPPPSELTMPAGRGNLNNRYPWKSSIVTTVFWIGEAPAGNNFTPNHASSWDANWAQSYGGFDNPDPAARRNFLPARFTPRQNPFYCALPYNDVTRGTTKPESRRCIPWFREAFEREGKSVCRDRWVAIRSRSGKVAYAQWSDCGPFRTDHWQYVFGSERPKPNLNKGAGLDVSPAVRDYLGLSSTDLTDWKFVDVRDVPSGPWGLHGENNTYLALRKSGGASRTNSRTADYLILGRGREL